MALQIMLPQQILAVVVAVGRADDGVDVLAGGLVGVGGGAAQVGRALVVELDEQDRAVDAIVKDAVVIRATDPGEVS